MTERTLADLRNRLEKRAPVTTQEALALLLAKDRRGETALDLADQLLRQWGGARGLAATRMDELVQTPGVDQEDAATVAAAFELARRALDVTRERVRISQPEDVFLAVRPLVVFEDRERTMVLVCDARHRLLHTEVVSLGGFNHAPVAIPEILSCVLRKGGQAFAVAHNHPGGDPTPSDADRIVTHNIERAADHVGLQFLGHYVVTAERWARASAAIPNAQGRVITYGVAACPTSSHIHSEVVQ